MLMASAIYDTGLTVSTASRSVSDSVTRTLQIGRAANERVISLNRSLVDYE
jgi:hypothetical protein